MARLLSNLGSGTRLGIPAVLVGAIVAAKLPAWLPASGRSMETRGADDDVREEEELEAYLYSEYAFPSGRPVDLQPK